MISKFFKQLLGAPTIPAPKAMVRLPEVFPGLPKTKEENEKLLEVFADSFENIRNLQNQIHHLYRLQVQNTGYSNANARVLVEKSEMIGKLLHELRYMRVSDNR